MGTRKTGAYDGLAGLSANHIHANHMDVVSPLRIARLRLLGDQDFLTDRLNHINNRVLNDNLDQGPAVHPFWLWVHKVGPNDALARVDHLLDKVECYTEDMVLLSSEIEVLGPCLLEAISTAYRERMGLMRDSLGREVPRPHGVIDTMSRLFNEIHSGRHPVWLVFTHCFYCWPEAGRGPIASLVQPDVVSNYIDFYSRKGL